MPRQTLDSTVSGIRYHDIVHCKGKKIVVIGTIELEDDAVLISGFCDWNMEYVIVKPGDRFTIERSIQE